MSCDLLWSGKIACNGKEIHVDRIDDVPSPHGWTARYPAPVEPYDGWTASIPVPIVPEDGWIARVPEEADGWVPRYPGPIEPTNGWTALVPPAIEMDGWIAHVPETSNGWSVRYPGPIEPMGGWTARFPSGTGGRTPAQLASSARTFVPASSLWEGWTARYPAQDRSLQQLQPSTELLASETRDGWVAHVPSPCDGWAARYPGEQRPQRSELLASETRDGWVAHIPEASSWEGWAARYPKRPLQVDVMVLRTNGDGVARIPQPLAWSDGQCKFRLWQGHRVCDDALNCGTAWMGEQVTCDTIGRRNCGFSMWSGQKRCETHYQSSIALLHGKARGVSGRVDCQTLWSGRSESCSDEDGTESSPIAPVSEHREHGKNERAQIAPVSEHREHGKNERAQIRKTAIWAGTRRCTVDDGCHVAWSGEEVPISAVDSASDEQPAVKPQRSIMRCQVLESGSIACYTESTHHEEAATPVLAVAPASAWTGTNLCNVPEIHGCATVWQGTPVDYDQLMEQDQHVASVTSDEMPVIGYYRTWSGVEQCSISREESASQLGGAARIHTKHRTCATLWSGSEGTAKDAKALEEPQMAEISSSCPILWHAEHVCHASLEGKCGIAWTGEQVCIKARGAKCDCAMWSGHRQCETAYDSSIALLDGKALGFTGHVACHTLWSGSSGCQTATDIEEHEAEVDLEGLDDAQLGSHGPVDLGFDLGFDPSWSASTSPRSWMASSTPRAPGYEFQHHVPTAAPSPAPSRHNLGRSDIWISMTTRAPTSRLKTSHVISPWDGATKLPGSWADVGAQLGKVASSSWAEVVSQFATLLSF
jgi:hypothetical protein